MRQELEHRVGELAPARWNANPEDVQRSVAKLVLTLMEFLRKLFEKQAIRRMEAGSLTAEETVTSLATQFELSPEDLNLDLGPPGAACSDFPCSDQVGGGPTGPCIPQRERRGRVVLAARCGLLRDPTRGRIPFS